MWGRTKESFSLSLISAYPRLASEKDDARRAAEDSSRREDILGRLQAVCLRISFTVITGEIHHARGVRLLD